MKFSRTLKSSFIDELNNIYDHQNSWWQKIVDDKETFILIRNDGIHVQSKGGLLLQVNQDSQNKIICKINEEFLNLRSEKNRYVVLEEKTTVPMEPIKRVEGLSGFVQHYAEIKQRISIFTSKERQAVQYLANNINQIVDIEVGFEGELKENAGKKSVPRIDMAAITDKGTFIFFEVKLFDNSEIKSEKTPMVVGQLQKYKKLICQYGGDIIEGYKNQLNIYKKLKGNFFKKRARDIDTITLYPNIRLIITGFDFSQMNDLVPNVRKTIEEGLAWPKGTKDLITTGDFKSLAKSNRLFLGLK